MIQSALALLVLAVPTFIVVIFLHWYLKTMLFQPVVQVMNERHAATEGAREKAAQSLELAEQKVAQYEAQLREARGAVYREQDAIRQQLTDNQNRALAEAREQNQKLIAEARQSIATQTAAARESLGREADALADKIVEAVLKGSRN